jgi:hypothetical protein
MSLICLMFSDLDSSPSYVCPGENGSSILVRDGRNLKPINEWKSDGEIRIAAFSDDSKSILVRTYRRQNGTQHGRVEVLDAKNGKVLSQASSKFSEDDLNNLTLTFGASNSNVIYKRWMMLENWQMISP